jgi:hypothetical protein
MFTRQADGQPMTAAEFFEGGNGMTLRDYFAAAALTGMTATSQQETYGNDADFHYHLALRSYSFADAMLAARAK